MYKHSPIRPWQRNSGHVQSLTPAEYRSRKQKKLRDEKRLEKRVAEHLETMRLQEQAEGLLKEVFGVELKPSSNPMDLLKDLE